ncbi:hypothetical protein PHYPSEUDO_006771 [Phytophthora pseudosyringae]|uniref:GAF domain-containing protein n=1 Tax=Phytophthora pseudosyringae TaxID=221518 RepID=A0A8T1VIA0_9STRA|nr:hypothetical protein PHYPSEUDO_006771 [Phytophthora pseudosyringae]
MSIRSSSSSPERGEAQCSANESEQDDRRASNVAPFAPSSSFFIIHELSSSVISPSGGTRNPPKLRRKDNEGGATSSIRARKEGLPSSGLRKKKARSKTPSSAPASSGTSATLRTSSSSALPSQVYEGHEADNDKDVQNDVHVNGEKRATELSILSRCGSAPDLPMYSPLSANVYSSSKKRALQGSTSPHSATLQRSRLTPLPATTRPAVVKPDSLFDSIEGVDTSQPIGHELDSVPLHSKDPLLQEKMCQYAHTISALKQRMVVLEREVSASTKYRHTTEKKIAQLSLENQRLQSEKTQQQARADELDKTVLRQRHEFDKLAARYAAVYANLQKLVDQHQNASDNSAQQSALQALARENQDFLRKLRVLEARHAEDKTLTSNQEKKIKRLKAEMEALQHMQEAKNREDDFDESPNDTDQVSRLAKPKKRTESDTNHGGRPSSASSSVSITSSTPRRPGSSARMQAVQPSTLGTASHLVTAEAYQYIDPSILKVLEKVDSQFSITNAINLSAVLKKWLNSCVHVVCSTHLPTVLQALLKRTCDLLHCEHAALLIVDHATHKLVATCSERGPERWELPLDKGIAGYAARHNMLCNVHCANDDPRFYSSTDSITGTTSREVLALPIIHELQLYLESQSHLPGGGDNNRAKTNNLGVFAVLRAWNTTHQKPFSANDQILGCLLAIQAGIILRQTAVTKTLQKINHKTHQILQMTSEIVAKASASHQATKQQNAEGAASSPPMPSEYPGASSVPSVVQLVAVAQKELGECLGIKQLRIFVLDAAVHKLWHVGEQVPVDSGDCSSLVAVRRYVSAQASLCALLLRGDATSIVLPEPSAEAAFNDTVDIPGGARGLYLVPILSPWGNGALPFGVVQVSRVAKARLSASPFALTDSEGAGNGVTAGSVADIVVNNEREAAQQTEDRLMLELLGHFCRIFAGLLHHVAAQQLYDACPPEIMQAQLATLSDHLDSLADQRRRGEGDEDEEGNESPTALSANASEVAISQLDRVTTSRRHASIATVTPPPLDARRVASADPKHRAPPASRRAASSPAKSSSYPSTVDTTHNHAPGALQDRELDDRVSHDPAASDDNIADAVLPASPDTVDVAADANTSVDGDEVRDAETSILESESKDPELLAPGPEPQQVVETAESWPTAYDSTEAYNPVDGPPDDWTSTPSDVNDSAQGEEQLAGEDGVGFTWDDNSTYDPNLWPAGDNVYTYEEGAAWGYGAVDNGALANEDEDGTNKHRRGSHLSTNSTYAIDLHLSSRASSAETDQPSGAL